jgi:hypothetical protein
MKKNSKYFYNMAGLFSATRATFFKATNFISFSLEVKLVKDCAIYS